MTNGYGYLVFFYVLSIGVTILAVILFFKVVSLKRQVKNLEGKVNDTSTEIVLIKKRLEKFRVDVKMDSNEVKDISEKMTSNHDFR